VGGSREPDLLIAMIGRIAAASAALVLAMLGSSSAIATPRMPEIGLENP
jgi:hypothetical protein